MSAVCPSTEELSSALRTTLSAEEERKLSLHLSGCETCRARLEELAGGSQWVKTRLQRLAGKEPSGQVGPNSPLPSPHLQKAMQELARPFTPASPAAADPMLAAGTRLKYFGDYEILGELGRGGMGVVYKARQTSLNRVVALKLIATGQLASESDVRRFRNEAEAAARLDHPNIVPIYEIGEHEERHYFSMKLVEGEPLSARIGDSRTRQSFLDIARLMNQIARAVHHAHQHGILHRDLKPGNILLDEEDQPHLTDFGLAKILEADSSLTRSMAVMGTPNYMAPEMAVGRSRDVTTAADVFSLGAILYELLSGRPPFQAETTAATIQQVLHADPVSPRTIYPNVPRDLATICLKCLEKESARRYSSAAAVAEELERFVNGQPILARPTTVPERVWRWAVRNPLVAVLVCALHVAIALGFCGILWEWRRAEQNARAANHQRELADGRAYAADMKLAASSAGEHGSLSSVSSLLDPWRDRHPDRRGWEWYYLNGLFHQEARTLCHRTNNVPCVAWSPDGRKVAAPDLGNSVGIWDAHSGRALRRFRGLPGKARVIAWDPSGSRLATAIDRTILIWDAESHEKLTAISSGPGRINCLSWRPDGRQIASGDQLGEVKIWDADSGAAVSSIPATDAVLSIAWHPNGKWLAVAGSFFDIRVWDTEQRHDLPYESGSSYSGFVSSVDWSPDGRWLAASGSDALVRVWSAITGKTTTSFSSHRTALWALKWSPDGQQMATADVNGLVRIWDPFNGDCLKQFRGHQLRITSLAWHPGGGRVASASLDGAVKIWDLNGSNSAIRMLSKVDQIQSVAWHPDGQRLATGSRDGSIHFWDGRGEEGPERLGNHQVWAWKVAWNPTGSRLASAGGDGVVKLWETSTRKELWRVQVFTNAAVRAIAWHPAGDKLAVTGISENMIMLDPGGRVIGSFKVHGEPMALAWSPDGRQLATRNQILDATTGEQVRLLRLHVGFARCLAYSPDGQRLASCADDGLAKIWDTKTGVELLRLAGHTSPVYGLAWSPDGTRLATGSWDKTVSIWNPDSGQLLCTLKDTNSAIMSVSWSPDGRQLAAGDMEGRIFIFDARAGYLAEQK